MSKTCRISSHSISLERTKTDCPWGTNLSKRSKSSLYRRYNFHFEEPLQLQLLSQAMNKMVHLQLSSNLIRIQPFSHNSRQQWTSNLKQALKINPRPQPTCTLQTLITTTSVLASPIKNQSERTATMRESRHAVRCLASA